MNTGWIVESNELDVKSLLKNESIFNVANGYIGIRGNFEEGYTKDIPTIKGNYINAFYEEVGITYGEKAYAFPDTMQKLVNIIDAQSITIQIGDESFSLFEGEIRAYKRYVDMQKGVYTRNIHWVSPKGEEVAITIKRLASFTVLELFAVHIIVERIKCDKPITITSRTTGDVENYTNSNDPRVGAGHAKILRPVECLISDEYEQITCETQTSKLKVTATTAHKVSSGNKVKRENDKQSLVNTYVFDDVKRKIEFTKYTIYTDTRRYEDVVREGIKLIEEVCHKSFEVLEEEQGMYLEDFWKVADIQIEGDDALQQGLRFNIYQLLQSVGKDKLSNIAAKGLSGEGYEGHYFWDTEIYMLPFFIVCHPALAKQLLRYRYTILDHARKRAKELGHKKGAAYAWRTITGDECSAYFPAGTAQYHLNGDIAYTYIQYYLATGDKEFIKEFGAEVIFETARIWLEIGHFHEGKFKIDAVTGPDEYTAIVNNNFYTNRLAQYNLKWAIKWYNLLKDEAPKKLQALVERIGLTEDELTLFEKAAEKMYLPYDESLRINAQDDTFLSKAVWDFESTPKEHYPLLLHYHPLTIYRYQVLKQADVVLSHFLLEEGIAHEVIKKSYDYYERITTHDSSLSCAIYSIIASKIGYEEKAYNYFIETARLDLDNTHNNTKDGLHTANMGGTWMSVVYGFAGLRIKEDHISLNPKLPKQWQGLQFNFLYKGATIQVDMKSDRTIIQVTTKVPLKIRIQDKEYEVFEDRTIEVK